MPQQLPKIPAGGVVAHNIRRLQAAIREGRPVRTPGARVSQTTRGVIVRPVGKRGGRTVQTNGMRFIGEYVEGVNHEPGDVVVVYSGAATGTHVCVKSRPGTDPDTNAPVAYSDPALGTFWLSLPMGTTVGAWT